MLTRGTRSGSLARVARVSISPLTSNPTRTSPVKRGKWVLQNLLGSEPPPPPPDVPPLVKDEGKSLVGTLHDVEVHRLSPVDEWTLWKSVIVRVVY